MTTAKPCWPTLDRTPGWYVPALRPSNRHHVDFRQVERLWVRNLPGFRHIQHALHA